MTGSPTFRRTCWRSIDAAPSASTAEGYDFVVPLLDGDHVTDDTGTGFVHTAPGHGREDFDIWMANGRVLEARGISSAIPYTVDANGALTAHAPGFEGKRVLNDKGEKGDANEAVIKALARRRQHHRARPAEASVSAFLALEEAGDLSQYAAMVHRDGQTYRERAASRGTAIAAPSRARTRHRARPAGCRSRARTASTA